MKKELTKEEAFFAKVCFTPMFTLGTLRANRGADPAIVQQEIKNKEKLAEYTAKPILERTNRSVGAAGSSRRSV